MDKNIFPLSSLYVFQVLSDFTDWLSTNRTTFSSHFIPHSLIPLNHPFTTILSLKNLDLLPHQNQQVRNNDKQHHSDIEHRAPRLSPSSFFSLGHLSQQPPKTFRCRLEHHFAYSFTSSIPIPPASEILFPRKQKHHKVHS